MRLCSYLKIEDATPNLLFYRLEPNVLALGGKHIMDLLSQAIDLYDHLASHLHFLPWEFWIFVMFISLVAIIASAIKNGVTKAFRSLVGQVAVTMAIISGCALAPAGAQTTIGSNGPPIVGHDITGPEVYSASGAPSPGHSIIGYESNQTICPGQTPPGGYVGTKVEPGGSLSATATATGGSGGDVIGGKVSITLGGSGCK